MLQTNLSNIGVVILAAGKGTRLGCTDIPKVMLDIGGKPIVAYIVETLEHIGFSPEQICLVIGYKKEKVIDYFQDRVTYAVQEEQKGTAHATMTGIQVLPEHITQVLVMGGDDGAFYRGESMLDFVAQHIEKNVVLSLLTTKVDDPVSFGRVVRHDNGDIEVIEKEYATEEQKEIKEVSTGTFCFDRTWFESMYPTMAPLRKLGEYGLPTALAVARDTKQPHQVVLLKDSGEWFGINTLEQLERADKKKQNKQNNPPKAVPPWVE